MFDRILTLSAPTPQNDQTHSNNSLAKADELFECVLPFCGVDAERVKYASDSFVTWNILEFFDKIPSNCFVQVFYLGK